MSEFSDAEKNPHLTPSQELVGAIFRSHTLREIEKQIDRIGAELRTLPPRTAQSPDELEQFTVMADDLRVLLETVEKLREGSK